MAELDTAPAVPRDAAGRRSTADAGRLDDLFDYDAGMADLLRDVDTNMDVPPTTGSNAARRGAAGGRERDPLGVGDDDNPLGLGIDEEVHVEKKKRVMVKLDEARLLSQNGIPKLRRISKDRIRFKGKGHEFSDVARLLSLYQLWLDDLYPKAKFADGLAMIEKLGHSKNMQSLRRAWIDEGKPHFGHGATRDEDDMVTTEPAPSVPAAEVPDPSRADADHVDGVDGVEPPLQSTRQEAIDGPDEDELAALFANDLPERPGTRHQVPIAQSAERRREAAEDNLDDEMEAMAEMEGMW